ncbi:TPA: hypothetical protein HA278_04035 [Candidatus Woesearchaeota archaeon]|nr:hypothetical protein [archaeon]HIJ11200.1 hypothetical protein [Candidatus Woesearchaeota archaeon]
MIIRDDLISLHTAYEEMEKWSRTMVNDFTRYKQEGDFETTREQFLQTIAGPHQHFINETHPFLQRILHELQQERKYKKVLNKLRLLVEPTKVGFVIKRAPSLHSLVPSSLPPHLSILRTVQGEICTKHDQGVWYPITRTYHVGLGQSHFSFTMSVHNIDSVTIDGAIILEKFLAKQAKKAREVVTEAIVLL